MDLTATIQAVCVQCGRPFAAHKATARYCSIRCKNSYTTARRQVARGAYEPRVCEQCGVAFVPTNGHQRFCDDACRYRAKRDKARTRDGGVQRLAKDPDRAVRMSDRAVRLGEYACWLDALDDCAQVLRAAYEAGGPAYAALPLETIDFLGIVARNMAAIQDDVVGATVLSTPGRANGNGKRERGAAR